MNILSFGEPEFDYKKQDQGSTEKHLCKYIWKLSFLFKEPFSKRKTLILKKMSQKKWVK